jgi:hypothetical protein
VSRKPITEQQHRGVAGYEDSSIGFNITEAMKNVLNVHPGKDANRSKFQQTDDNQNTEEMQEYSSNTDQSGAIIVYPWKMAGTSDHTELEDVYLIYPEDGDDNDTDVWNRNMSDGDLLLSHMAELQLFQPDYKNSTNFTETSRASSIIEHMSAENSDTYEKEDLVASHSEYKRIRGRKEMQENLKGQEGEDDEQGATDENDNNSRHKDRSKEGKVDSLAHGHALTHSVQNKSTYVPKRSFVSENLKMRISQLATREGRPGPRGNTGADKVQSINSRYHTGQRSSQSFRAMKVVEEQPISHMKTARNRSPAPSADIITARAHSLQGPHSNAENSTGISKDPTARPRTSRIQNMFSHRFDGYCSEGTVTDINVSQRVGRLRQGSVQQGGSETMLQHLRESSATEPTDAEATRTSKSDHNGIVENIHPAVRRKVTETLQGTFGARTTTRDRPSSFLMRPSHADTKTYSGTGSAITKFEHHPPKLEGPPPPVTSLGSDTRESDKGAISVEGAGLINVVGPIPKGFTDPVTLPNPESVNQRDPLFHLPHSIQPQPFLNQFAISKVSQISESITPSSSGVSSFNPEMSVQTQSFHQHEVLRHAGNHSPQKYIQTVIVTPTANATTFDSHKWQENRQDQLPSTQEPDCDAPQLPSPLTAQKFNLPSSIPADFNKPLLFHLATPQKTTSTHAPVAAVHSPLHDETTRAKIIPLPQTPSLAKFLRFSDQQLKQLGEQKESFMSLGTHGSQLSSKLPAEGRPAPLSALHQLDARRHSAELEYTKKLQEYFLQLQNYYSQQPHK